MEKSILLNPVPTDDDLVGKSHWWGAPDLPADVPYPYVMVDEGEDDAYPEPLTFICQIRMEDVAPFEHAGLLPRNGMLYFFAAIDHFLGYYDTPLDLCMHGPADDTVRVIYVEDVPADVQPYDLHWEDTGASVFAPAEAIEFYEGGGMADGHAMLTVPYQDEVSGCYPGYISLLQVDECDRWGLRFYDCGTLYLLIRPEDLRAKRFDKLVCEVFTY